MQRTIPAARRTLTSTRVFVSVTYCNHVQQHYRNLFTV